MRLNLKYNVYQRRGYRIQHHVQRMETGFEHLFLLIDQGAKYLPKPKHLIRMLIPINGPSGLIRSICHASSGAHDCHCIWFRVIVKYKKG